MKTPTPITTTATALQTAFPSRPQQERENMIMRETDQWMAEYNKTRAAK